MFRKKMYLIEIETIDKDGRLIKRDYIYTIFKSLKKVYKYLDKLPDKPTKVAKLTYKSKEYTYAILDLDVI